MKVKELAKQDGFTNIREVVIFYKEKFIPKWKMVDLIKTREKIVPFKT